MRKLKFRAWDREAEQMYLIDDIRDADYARRRFYALEDLDINEVSADWMQFTGLADKDGKEIYEGDIVEHFDTGTYGEEWVFPYKGVVEYVKDTMSFRIRPITATEKHGYYTNKSIVVIGNVFENPDLLK